MKRLFCLLFICALLILSSCNEDSSTAPIDNSINSDVSADIADVQEIAEEGCSAHVDENTDDICDECGNSVIITLDIFGINDLHGKILDGELHPGVDELTTYLQKAQENNKHTLLLSAGDMWQGAAESNQTKGQLMTDWMNRMDFAAMALGNHEFDWGESYIDANSEFADFPFLAINVYDKQTNQPVTYCESSVMVEYEGAQVGIIGAIGDCYSSIASDHTKGIYFKTGNQLTRLVMDEADKLRNEGADFIIYMLHDGLGDSYADAIQPVSNGKLSSYYDTRLSDGYVDLVFEGHTHQAYILEDAYGVYHLQNGGDNNGISHVSVQLHTIDGTAQVQAPQLIRTSEYVDLPPSMLITELMVEYEDVLAPVLESIGYLNHSYPGNNLRQLVADLYYMEGVTHWGSNYDIVLGGGFISIRNPGYLAKGDVTYGDLQDIFPFDNELVLCSIKGQDLKEKFFETDHSSYFICCGEYGEEVRENLDPNATYYVVVDTYTSTYKPNNLTEIERYGADVYARDLLAAYIQNGGLT